MLATILYGLQGTPYLYQGEELGMTNAPYTLEEYKDIEIVNMIADRRAKGYSDEEILRSIHAKGRDNARTPMQWNDGENAGFTTGTPWLKVNPNYTAINAASQEADANSVLNYYRYLIALRKRENVILDGAYEELFPEREDLFAYTRKNDSRKLTVVANFTDREIEFPQALLEQAGTPEIGNYPDWPAGSKLRPYEAVMYFKDTK